MTAKIDNVKPDERGHDNASFDLSTLGQICDSSLGAVLSVIDFDCRFKYVNAPFTKAFGLAPAQMIGKTLADFYDQKALSVIMPYVHRVFAGESVTYERLGHAQGSTGVWHTVALIPWRDQAGKIIGVVQSAMRVHELKATMEALRVANERLAFHIDNSPHTVIELDDGLRVTRCSTQIDDLIGVKAAALIGEPLIAALGDPSSLVPLIAAFAHLQNGNASRSRVEAVLTHRSGEKVYSEWFNSALTDASGKVTSMMALVQNTSARTLAEARLLEMATLDSLTGLHNRRSILGRIDQAFIRANRSGATVALLFVDLDGFKTVNDRFGHNAGDLLLCEITRRLQRTTRESDVIGRIGGDEFIILAEADVSRDSLAAMSERIQSALGEPCALSSETITIGASIGIAIRAPGQIGTAEVIRQADAAMYEAKHAGKGRIRYAENV